jgi:hypothetical protein
MMIRAIFHSHEKSEVARSRFCIQQRAFIGTGINIGLEYLQLTASGPDWSLFVLLR